MGTADQQTGKEVVEVVTQPSTPSNKRTSMVIRRMRALIAALAIPALGSCVATEETVHENKDFVEQVEQKEQLSDTQRIFIGSSPIGPTILINGEYPDPIFIKIVEDNTGNEHIFTTEGGAFNLKKVTESGFSGATITKVSRDESMSDTLDLVTNKADVIDEGTLYTWSDHVTNNSFKE